VLRPGGRVLVRTWPRGGPTGLGSVPLIFQGRPRFRALKAGTDDQDYHCGFAARRRGLCLPVSWVRRGRPPRSPMRRRRPLRRAPAGAEAGVRGLPGRGTFFWVESRQIRGSRTSRLRHHFRRHPGRGRFQRNEDPGRKLILRTALGESGIRTGHPACITGHRCRAIGG